jgi:hypothetical protein
MRAGIRDNTSCWTANSRLELVVELCGKPKSCNAGLVIAVDRIQQTKIDVAALRCLAR